MVKIRNQLDNNVKKCGFSARYQGGQTRSYRPGWSV